MTVEVRLVDGGYRIGGGWDEAAMANAFLAHLTARAFSPATIRAYAFDVVNLARFLADRRLVPVDSGFFTELAAYLSLERPPGCPHWSVSWCCVGQPAGQR